MDLGLAGLKAVVTGGTKGIGRAVADHFAREGTDVAICARNAGEVTDAVAALRATGVKATGRALDVADGPALMQWVQDAAANSAASISWLPTSRRWPSGRTMHPGRPSSRPT